MRVLVVAAFVIGIAPRVMAAEDEQPATITILDQTYSVVPDEEIRKLGFDVPEVKPDENAAYDYLKAIEAYLPLPPLKGLDNLRDQVMADRWTDESGPLASYVEGNEGVIDLLKTAASKNVCHFPVLVPAGSSLDETSPSGIILPQLAKLREFSRFLVTAGKAHEFEAEYAKALDAYLLAMQVGNHTAQDPTLIAGLVGLACNSLGARAIEQCLVRNEIDGETLAKVHARLAASANKKPSVAVSMHGERAWSTSMIEHAIAHPDRHDDLALDNRDLKSRALSGMLRSEEGQAQIRQDVREFWEAMDKALDLPLPEFIKTEADQEPAKAAQARQFPPNIMGVIGPAIGSARLTFARNALAWTVLDVEFALARYAGKHGQYPASLDRLKDLMLSDGIDPFSGKRLHYRLEDDGAYTIWSVGEDLTDDGGVVSAESPDWDADDYVWNSVVIYGEQ